MRCSVQVADDLTALAITYLHHHCAHFPGLSCNTATSSASTVTNTAPSKDHSLNPSKAQRITTRRKGNSAVASATMTSTIAKTTLPTSGRHAATSGANSAYLFSSLAPFDTKYVFMVLHTGFTNLAFSGSQTPRDTFSNVPFATTERIMWKR